MSWTVTGSIHPPTVLNPHYTGPYIREDQVPLISKRLIGLPVFYEHYYPAGPIGIVRSVGRGPNREITASLELQPDRYPLANSIIEKIKDSQLRGLSIGMLRDITPDYSSHGEPYPIEISIVETGRYPETHIIAHGNNKSVSVNLWGIQRISGIDFAPPVPGHTIKSVISFREMQQHNMENIAANLAAVPQAQPPVTSTQEDLAARVARLEAENAELLENNRRLAPHAKDSLRSKMEACMPMIQMVSPDEETLKRHKDTIWKALENGHEVVEFVFSLGKALNKNGGTMAELESRHLAANPNNPAATAATGTIPANAKVPYAAIHQPPAQQQYQAPVQQQHQAPVQQQHQAPVQQQYQAPTQQQYQAPTQQQYQAPVQQQYQPPAQQQYQAPAPTIPAHVALSGSASLAGKRPADIEAPSGRRKKHNMLDVIQELNQEDDAKYPTVMQMSSRDPSNPPPGFGQWQGHPVQTVPGVNNDQDTYAKSWDEMKAELKALPPLKGVTTVIGQDTTNNKE